MQRTVTQTRREVKREGEREGAEREGTRARSAKPAALIDKSSLRRMAGAAL
jgi:hypothetical protein